MFLHFCGFCIDGDLGGVITNGKSITIECMLPSSRGIGHRGSNFQMSSLCGNTSNKYLGSGIPSL